MRGVIGIVLQKNKTKQNKKYINKQNKMFGWRAAYIMRGVIGIVLALGVAAFVPEPRDGTKIFTKNIYHKYFCTIVLALGVAAFVPEPRDGTKIFTKNIYHKYFCTIVLALGVAAFVPEPRDRFDLYSRALFLS